MKTKNKQYSKAEKIKYYEQEMETIALVAEIVDELCKNKYRWMQQRISKIKKGPR